MEWGEGSVRGREARERERERPPGRGQSKESAAVGVASNSIGAYTDQQDTKTLKHTTNNKRSNIRQFGLTDIVICVWF